MTTIYVVKVTNKQEGYTTADVFSTLEKAQEFLVKYSAVDANAHRYGSIEFKELDAPDYPFLKKDRDFIVVYNNDGAKEYICTAPDGSKPFLSPDLADATVFERTVRRNTLLRNLERCHFVNLEIEEI